MNSNDAAKAVMRHHEQTQAEEASRIRSRSALQAKLSLTLATALFSSFATLVAFRYIWLDRFSAMSALVLVLLAGGLRRSWRAV